jgi:hypothetical protein
MINRTDGLLLSGMKISMMINVILILLLNRFAEANQQSFRSLEPGTVSGADRRSRIALGKHDLVFEYIIRMLITLEDKINKETSCCRDYIVRTCIIVLCHSAYVCKVHNILYSMRRIDFNKQKEKVLKAVTTRR